MRKSYIFYTPVLFCAMHESVCTISGSLPIHRFKIRLYYAVPSMARELLIYRIKFVKCRASSTLNLRIC